MSNIVVDIGSLFTWTEGRGYIDKNPFHKLNLPKNNNSTPPRRPWEYEHLMLFLKSKHINRNAFVVTVVAMYSGMRLSEICVMQNKNIGDKCFHKKKKKTKASARVIPVHHLIGPKIYKLKTASENEFLIKGINGGGYDNKRSWNFQKKLGRLRDKIGIQDGVVFHSLRNTFATRMENLGMPRNRINQLMGHNTTICL